MTLNPGLTTEITKLSPSAVIELFVIDATNLGGGLFYFHSGTNQLTQNVVWQGQEYVRFPIGTQGFEFTGVAQFPRPKIQVSNVLSSITQILLEYNDLQGAKVTRKRTLAKFLDAVNFTGGTNPTADPTAEFDDDIYYIDRKSNEDRDIVEFELAASIDLVGVNLPRRQIIQNICTWKYRGTECGYTGIPIADENDQPLVGALTSFGQAVISAQQAVIAAQATLTAAQDALTTAANAMSVACGYSLQSTAYNVTITLGVLTTTTDVVVSTSTPVFGDPSNPNVVTTAYSGGSPVSLGTTYRQGNFRQQLIQTSGLTSPETIQLFEIQTWSISAGCSAATTAYNTAKTTRDNAVTALATANTNLATALAALPSNDPLYNSDVCGKRLTSCKIRFGDTAELPYGSFPSAGLTS